MKKILLLSIIALFSLSIFAMPEKEQSVGILNFDFSHDSDFKLFAATLIVELNIVADNINREHYCDDILNLDDEKIDFFYERAIKTYIKLVKNDDISFDNVR